MNFFQNVDQVEGCRCEGKEILPAQPGDYEIYNSKVCDWSVNIQLYRSKQVLRKCLWRLIPYPIVLDHELEMQSM